MDKKSAIGLMETPLYVAKNGCYVVSAKPTGWGDNSFDLRSPKGEYIGDGIYGSLESAKRGADLSGENLYREPK